MRWRFGWFRRPEPPLPMQRPTEYPLTFEGVLADAVAGGQAVNPLAEALDVARGAVPAADNMGRTGDVHDLYHLIDQLSAAVVATYPQSQCFDGCGRCCNYPTAFFDMYPEEWQRVHDHLETRWTPERRAAMVRRFWAEHGPRMPIVRLFEWFQSLNVPIFPTRKALPLACPLLENGRCSVWEARPLPCRTYGQFTAKISPWSSAHVYACAEQGEALEGALQEPGLQVMLPDVGPVMAKQLAFVSGRKRVMASWIARSYPKPRGSGGIFGFLRAWKRP